MPSSFVVGVVVGAATMALAALGLLGLAFRRIRQVLTWQERVVLRAYVKEVQGRL